MAADPCPAVARRRRAGAGAGPADLGRWPRRARVVRGRARARSRPQRCARRAWRRSARRRWRRRGARCDERRYADAHRALALARELAVPRAQVDARREQRCANAKAADAGIERLLAAGRCRARGRPARRRRQRRTAAVPARARAAAQPHRGAGGARGHAGRPAAAGAAGAGGGRTGRSRGRDPPRAGRRRRATSILPDALAGSTAGQPNSAAASADADLRRGRLAQRAGGLPAVLAADPGDADATRGLRAVGDCLCRAQRASCRGFPFRRGRGGTARRPQAIAPTRPRSPRPSSTWSARARARRATASRLPAAERQRRLRQLLQQAPPPKRAATCSRRRATARSTSCARRARSRRRIRACVSASARLLPAAKALLRDRNCAATASIARANAWMRGACSKATAPALGRDRGDGWRSAGSRSATSAWAPAKLQRRAGRAGGGARAGSGGHRPGRIRRAPARRAPRPTDRRGRPARQASLAAAPAARPRAPASSEKCRSTLARPLSASRCHSAASRYRRTTASANAGGIVGDQHVLAIAQVHALDRAGGGHHRLAVRHAQVDLALDAGAETQRRHRDPRAVHVRRQVRHVAVDLDARLRRPSASIAVGVSLPMQWKRTAGSRARIRGNTSPTNQRTASTLGGWRKPPTNTRSWRCVERLVPGRRAGAGWRGRRPSPAVRRAPAGCARRRSPPAWHRLRAIMSSSSARVRSDARISAASPATSAPRRSRR